MVKDVITERQVTKCADEMVIDSCDVYFEYHSEQQPSKMFIKSDTFKKS